jgi:hypothetical protein
MTTTISFAWTLYNSSASCLLSAVLPGDGGIPARALSRKYAAAPEVLAIACRGFLYCHIREKNHELFFGLTKLGVKISLETNSIA